MDKRILKVVKKLILGVEGDGEIAKGASPRDRCQATRGQLETL